VILCSEEARHSPLLSDSGEGRLQSSGTWYLEAVIVSLQWVEGWLFSAKLETTDLAVGVFFRPIIHISHGFK